MHYYQHNIKDFRAGTYQMTRTERWIYRDMLDVIYDTEKPLPDSLDAICAMIGVRSDEEKKVVAELLLYKFTQVEGGYMNQRAAQEIEQYHKGLDQASAAGKASAAKRAAEKQRKLNEAKASEEQQNNKPSTTVERPLNDRATNQEPVTNNQRNTPQTPQGGPSVPDASKSRGVRLQTFLDDCKAKGERPIRDYKPLWTYSTDAKLPEDFVALAWVEFVRRHTGDGTDVATVQKDWRQKFLKYVQGNYYRLWAQNSQGEYFLTTQGKQAESVAEAGHD